MLRMLVLMVLLLSVFAGVSGFHVSPNIDNKINFQEQTPALAFEDGFEIESNWSLFEEIVNNDPCYGDGIGSVSRSTAQSYEGLYSLSVWANETLSTYSNHLIAYKDISPVYQYGDWKYVVHAFIDPATLDTGQTGPEFSMQNTRLIGVNDYRTSIAGIQYIANPYDSNYQNWNVWHEFSAGHAGWTSFTNEGLIVGTWYTMTLDVDYSSNQYSSFTLEGGGVVNTYDLSSFKIAAENRFTDEAFVLTLESENLWNNCGLAGEFDYRVFYDAIRLENSVSKLFLPLIQHVDP